MGAVSFISSVHRWNRRRIILAICLAAIIAVLVFVVLQAGLGEAAGALVLWLREAGPAVFFTAMAVLPALGFPMLPFTLAAGPVFGPTLGTGWVIAWSMTAVVVNLLLSYWLANRALRPLVGRLVAWLGFRLPESAAGGAWQMTLIVRLAPGPPFWVQSYLLGLIRVPLVPYMVVSTLVMAGYITALVCGGEAIANGSGRMAFTAVGLLVITIAVLQLLRKRMAARTQAPATRE